MAMNLIDMLKDQVGDQLIGHASKFLGESQTTTGSALGSILPTLMGTLIDKGGNEKGAAGIMDLIKGTDAGILDNIGGLFGGGASSVNNLLGGGSSIVSALLGDKVGKVVDIISSVSGMKSGNTSSLLKMAAPFLMSFIGKQVKSKGLDIGGLMGLLSGQKDSVKSALPSGMGSLLGLSGLGLVKDTIEDAFDGAADLAGDAVHAGKKAVHGAANLAGDAVETGAKVGGGLMKWIIPALLALIVLGWLAKKGCSTGVDAIDKTSEAVLDKTTDVTKGAADMVGNAVGAVTGVASDFIDAAGNIVIASGDAIANAFSNVNEAAKAGLANIKFTANSAGGQVMDFIKNGAKGPNSFRFNDLTFATGSSAITGASVAEIDNLAAIMNAYPNLKILVEGHTDNTGDAAANNKLSFERAQAVKNRLASKKIDINRIAAVGYGSLRPVGDNNTEEGRAQNRRIEFKIIN